MMKMPAVRINRPPFEVGFWWYHSQQFLPRWQQSGASNPRLLISTLCRSVFMEQIFYARGKGRATRALTVFTDGQQYRLDFLILGRTNPTKTERAAGAKEKRFEILNESFHVQRGQEIIPTQFPLPELVQQFVDFLIEGKGHDTDSH
ncbi:hypothetical protein ACSPAH_23045 [Buttiauxella agrestis]